ncbi:hypothetical protein NHF46_03965 [Arthrobacter alpinus]|nr:hypothetical protein [Arthrobacter alpinus]
MFEHIMPWTSIPADRVQLVALAHIGRQMLPVQLIIAQVTAPPGLGLFQNNLLIQRIQRAHNEAPSTPK